MTRYAEEPLLDVEAIAEKWLKECGACDFGLSEYGCHCPADEDYRPVMLSLVQEVERLRSGGDSLLPAGTQTCVELGVAVAGGVSRCMADCDQLDHTPDRRRFIHTTPWEAIPDLAGGGS